MAIAGELTSTSSNPKPKPWNLLKFCQSSSVHTSSSSSSTQQIHTNNNHSYNDYQHGRRNYDGGYNTSSFRGGSGGEGGGSKTPTVCSVARSLIPVKRRLKLDPPNHLYFPYEPGKQVRSAVRIKNTSKSHVAFKFQTTAPKSCYMRPPGGILAPGEHIVTTVFKFVEQPENNEKMQDLKKKVKFKIMSLKVKEGTEYAPELFDEQKDQANVERILQVIFLDPDRPSSAMEKLIRQLAEAEADVETRKKPPTDNGPTVVGEGLVIDEWKERREKYLAQQQMIMVAIDALNEPMGSNKTSISKYMESKYQNLPAGHATLLKHHLNRMKDCGQLIFWKNNYMRPRPDFIKRGRGRPPKSKDGSHGTPTTDGPAKPRGRPRKDEMDSGDPSGASVPLKKMKVSPDNGEQPMKTGRGRGRPPKAKPPTGGEGVSAQA